MALTKQNRTNTIGKYMNPLISRYVLSRPLVFFYKDYFGIE